MSSTGKEQKNEKVEGLGDAMQKTPHPFPSEAEPDVKAATPARLPFTEEATSASLSKQAGTPHPFPSEAEPDVKTATPARLPFEAK